MSCAVTWLLLSTVDWKENKNISMSEKPNQSVIGWLNMSSRPILTPLVRTREYFVKIIQFLGWSQPGEGAEDCVDHRTEAGNWSRKVGLDLEVYKQFTMCFPSGAVKCVTGGGWQAVWPSTLLFVSWHNFNTDLPTSANWTHHTSFCSLFLLSSLRSVNVHWRVFLPLLRLEMMGGISLHNLRHFALLGLQTTNLET